ncbi:MAG: TPR end-of-group domain-containing protein [Alphaproteobacteria bacterium]
MNTQGTHKPTETELKRVANLIRRSKADNKPFYLFVGAGASLSAGIPSASDLVAEIQENFKDSCSSIDDDKKGDYQACMKALTISERKTLIQNHLDKAQINWGHLALASLMINGFIGRVLTFNFDLLLEKALTFLGADIPVYDFGTAPTSQITQLAEPAIIHLHGQGHGLKLINDEGETKEHIAKLEPLFKGTFDRGNCAVIGYSGQADPYMKLFERLYEKENHLCWFHYEKTPSDELKEAAAKYSPFQLIGKGDFDQTMLSLANQLGCWPPKLFDNPLAHFQEKLGSLTPFPSEDPTAPDLLQSLKDKLEKQIPKWDFEASLDNQIRLARASTGEENTQALEKLFSDFKANRVTFSDDQKSELAWAYINWGYTFHEQGRQLNGIEAKVLYEQAIEKYAKAIEIKPDSYQAFSNWGVALNDAAKQASGTEAKALHEQAIEKYAKAIEIKPDDHQVFYNWGVALHDLAKQAIGDEAKALHKQAIEKYAKAIEIKPDYHDAFCNWGITLSSLAKLTQDDEAINLFEQAKAKFTSAKDSGLYDLACLHALMGELQDAMACLVKSRSVADFPGKEHMLTDSDLDPLRELPEFQEFVESL